MSGNLGCRGRINVAIVVTLVNSPTFKKKSYKLAAFAATLCIFVKVVSSKANMQSTFLKIVFLYLVRNCSVVTRTLVALIFSTIL